MAASAVVAFRFVSVSIRTWSIELCVFIRASCIAIEIYSCHRWGPVNIGRSCMAMATNYHSIARTLAQVPRVSRRSERSLPTASVAVRQIHLVHGLAISPDQQSLKRLRKAGPLVSRGGAAKKDPVPRSAH